MKHILTIILTVAIATAAHATSHVHLKVVVAQLADSAYRAGNYEEAVTGYEEILASGLASADLYYNLGNAYYRSGQLGLAILNYERALRLEPGMSDARQNLQLANSKTVDRITVLPRFFVVDWYNALITRVTPHTWRILFLLFLTFTGVSLVTLFLTHRITFKKISLLTLLLFALLSLLALFFLFKSTHYYNSHREAIVIEPSVTVKSSPETESVDKLILHEGTKVTITETLAGWNKITLADGTTGWCQEENLERI